MSETYRRLPGRSFGLFGTYSIWAGTDHVLAVESRRFIENYRRFYYADIQAIQISERHGIGLPLEIVVGLAMLMLVASTFRHPWLAILSAPAVVIYIWDKFRGQRCVCSVRTATGRWRIPALSRLKAARACVEAVRPLIEGSQGVVNIEAALEQGAVPQFAESATPPRESGLAYMWPLFVLALISGALGWYDATHLVSTRLASAEWVLSFSVVAMGVLALIMLRNPTSAGPRLAAISILLLQGLRITFAGVQFTVETTANAARAQGSPTQAFDLFLSELSIADNGIQIVAALAAVAGIFTLLTHRKSTV